MQTVTKDVNCISARALHKRQFEVLLNEVESLYKGLKMYNNVQWLSRGFVLIRFIECVYNRDVEVAISSTASASTNKKRRKRSLTIFLTFVGL